MKIGGHVLITDPDAPRIIERDTLKCTHCQRIVEVKPGSWGQVYLVPDDRQPSGYREEAGAYCRNCMGPLCLPCDDAGGCEHWEKRLEREEAQARRRR